MIYLIKYFLINIVKSYKVHHLISDNFDEALG